jgi:glutamate dehydrogenase/leucine dehydrogenase
MIKKDCIGPEYLMEIYDPQTGMEGFLVIDNTSRGLGKGGLRMTPDISLGEVFRLARAMTFKNALYGLPFGGAKAGIRWSGGNKDLKKKFIQSFARSIKILTPKKYVAGPDVGTGEEDMKWFVEEVGNWHSATGKPANLCMKIFGKEGEKCGIPHEFGSTGFGVAQATKVAAELLKMNVKKTTVAIDGFGNVGSFTFHYLKNIGFNVVAVSDIRGGIYNPKGLNKNKLDQLKKKGKSVTNYIGAKKLKRGEIFGLAVDILIPASVTDVINEKNKKTIKAKIIVEGANIPMSEKIENELFRKGVLVIPDFAANAGGVISSYAEYRGYNPKKMFEIVKSKIEKTVKKILKESIRKKINPRQIAMEMALKNLRVNRRPY